MHKDSNPPANTCRSCKTKFEGKFCNNCGEKAFHESDFKVKKFAEQTVEVFTHFDSKFVRSVKYIFGKPGFITDENLKGIRVKYAKPMQIFLLSNIFFFLVTHWTGVTDYVPNIGDEKYGGISNYFIFRWLESFDLWVINQIRILTDIKFAHFKLTQEEFSDRFLLNSYVYSKSFLILLVPVSGLVTFLFYWKKFKYFTGTLIFSAHFISFQLVSYAIVSIFLMKYHLPIFQPIDWLFFKTWLKPVTEFFFTGYFELTTLLFWWPYLYFALRRLFPQEHFLLTLVKAYFMSRILYFLTFIAYKKFLIIVTLWLMH